MLRRAVKTLLVNAPGANNAVVKGAAMSAVRQERWDLFAGVLLERMPIVTKALDPIEKEYLAHLNQIEFEQSLKSDFEVREENDRKIAELQRLGKLDVDMDVAVQQTAQDLKDAWKEELAQFQFSDRLTEADRRNDTTSLRRKLDATLVLLVDQQLGRNSHMLLPQGRRQAGETMRQTAERVLQERCGASVNAVWYGNAPCGFYKYKYPLAERKETVGAKIFFFRAAHKGGEVKTSEERKFEWLDAGEVQSRVQSGSYASSLKQFML